MMRETIVAVEITIKRLGKRVNHISHSLQNVCNKLSLQGDYNFNSKLKILHQEVKDRILNTCVRDVITTSIMRVTVY